MNLGALDGQGEVSVAVVQEVRAQREADVYAEGSGFTLVIIEGSLFF